MRVFNSVDEIKNIEETVVALGNFDGIHRGHSELITRTVRSAEAAGLKSAVFTFSNHPKNVTSGRTVVKNIMYFEDKVKLLESMGVDYMFNLPFTEEIMVMSPQRFIDELLLGKFRMRQAYCGFNHRFGYKAEGTPETLIKAGIERGFGIHVLEPYIIDGNLVSSSFIRELIEKGEMEQCAKYMGRCYSIGGEVVVGNKLGRTIGFPTVNLVIDETMVTPPNGVYATTFIYEGTAHPSITNVGVKPTIGSYDKNVETHIFNFSEDLYGRTIRVEFLKKMRDERKFESIEALSKQITADCISARAFHRELANERR